MKKLPFLHWSCQSMSMGNFKKPFRLDSNLLRIDDTSIHKSLRECLANALIHADFHGRRGTMVDKEFRKIVIANPGTFRIGIDEAIAGGISDARNGRIFNMFALINVGERSGTGICDVYHIWAENGFKEPSYVETVDPDRIVLTLQMDPYDNGDDGNDGNNDGNDGSLTQNELYVLQVDPGSRACWEIWRLESAPPSPC